LTSERDLSIKLQNVLRDRDQPEVSAVELEQLNKTIHNLQLESAELSNQLAERYPAYHALRFNHETIPLEDVAIGMEEDQLLINYFVGKVRIFALLVQPNGENEVYVIDATPDYLRELIQRFLPTLTDPTLSILDDTAEAPVYPTSASAAAAYRTDGNELYQLLLAPILKNEVPPQRIIIIPDGVLNLLPFGVLPTATDDFGEDWTACPFFIKQTAVSYAYSAAMLQLMKDQPSAGYEAADLAVFYHPEFADQAENISTIMAAAGVSLQKIEGRGDRSQFIENVCRHPYIHLATHGVIDPDVPTRSHLQLGKTTDGVEGEFYFADVFAQWLAGEFVFISACDAARGRLEKGEGILSLTRGFAYAGTKSMVSPLWRIMEGSTNLLTEKFYKALASGDT
ncbi:MAG: CHAT domain-containing protein, partial [Bacteroidota bacterium]